MECTPIGFCLAVFGQGNICHDDECSIAYETIEALAPSLLKKLIATELPIAVLLNINFTKFQPEGG